VKTKTYEELKDFIFNLPVIDCHEHTMGPKFAPFYKEPIASLIQGYFQSDLLSAGATEKEMKILIPLIMFHLPVRNRIAVESIGEIADTNVNTLEKYLEACRKIFIKMKEKGAVGMKDQSAYERIINFENVSRHKAEKLFNFIIENPRNSLGWPEAKPLDDYLFHKFIEMAEELSLPVQIHTGHIAGIRNEISKTNAVLLTSILEKYKNVKFDLFHGNWPYMGELLFLAKNYPNVHIDLCWVNIIDPYYTSQLLCDAITSIPHSKIHGFGGDYGDIPEYSFAHLEIIKILL
jgi:hypothetical protein